VEGGEGCTMGYQRVLIVGKKPKGETDEF